MSTLFGPSPVFDKVNEKPEEVQLSIRAILMRVAWDHADLDPESPQLGHYVERALWMWQQFLDANSDRYPTEELFAKEFVRRMRHDPVWGQILREGTQ